jgi:hypothetical protein
MMSVKKNKESPMKVFVILLVIIAVSITAYYIMIQKPSASYIIPERSEKPQDRTCSSYSTEICPDGCVVCPPCEACSSVSCQTEEFCRNMGFNATWYDEVRARLAQQQETKKGIKIASWKLDITGVGKAYNSTIMEMYAGKIKNYDVIFIQGLQESSGTFLGALCGNLPDYNCIVSSRSGRTVEKEQYIIIYKRLFDILDIKDYNPEYQNEFEHPPVRVKFGINGYEFSAYTIKTYTTAAKLEISALQKLVKDEGDVIILGSLNADCGYYDRAVENNFAVWTWIVKDSDDTTVAKTDCAYERILLNSNMQTKFINYGIDKDITYILSDYYLVWTEIDI